MNFQRSTLRLAAVLMIALIISPAADANPLFLWILRGAATRGVATRAVATEAIAARTVATRIGTTAGTETAAGRSAYAYSTSQTQTAAALAIARTTAPRAMAGFGAAAEGTALRASATSWRTVTLAPNRGFFAVNGTSAAVVAEQQAALRMAALARTKAAEEAAFAAHMVRQRAAQAAALQQRSQMSAMLARQTQAEQLAAVRAQQTAQAVLRTPRTIPVVTQTTTRGVAAANVSAAAGEYQTLRLAAVGTRGKAAEEAAFAVYSAEQRMAQAVAMQQRSQATAIMYRQRLMAQIQTEQRLAATAANQNRMVAATASRTTATRASVTGGRSTVNVGRSGGGTRTPTGGNGSGPTGPTQVVRQAANDNQKHLIVEGRQGKHLPGHNNYVSGKSVITDNPEKLATASRLGTPVNSVPRGAPGFKERVDYNRPIGYHADEAGKMQSTTKAIIHHSKDGVHIVPARP